MSKIQTIRGMHDILPEEITAWQHVERITRAVVHGYGYEEIRLPLLEQTELFARSAGETSDIVEKQMYSFTDRDGSQLSLRPEGTAGCVRAYIQNGLHRRGQQRLWYGGSMFRHERPQKGRYRQFDQIGVEAFGIDDAALDVELIAVMSDVFERLGVRDAVTCELNSIGDVDDRVRYRQALVEYLSRYRDELDEDSARRLDRNPLRVLDSKDERTREIVAGAPRLAGYLGDESRAHFDDVRNLLDARGIAYQLNDTLVRGLDYYNRSVFEWTTDRLGAQGTVCAGGRYDGLVGQLGGPATSAAGFAMGVDRVVLLAEALSAVPAGGGVDVYVVCPDDHLRAHAFDLAQQVRGAVPHAAVRMNLGGGRMKAQMKRADASGAAVVLIVAEDEVSRGQVSVKYLRDEREQRTLPVAAALALLKQEI